MKFKSKPKDGNLIANFSNESHPPKSRLQALLQSKGLLFSSTEIPCHYSCN